MLIFGDFSKSEYIAQDSTVSLTMATFNLENMGTVSAGCVPGCACLFVSSGPIAGERWAVGGTGECVSILGVWRSRC